MSEFLLLFRGANEEMSRQSPEESQAHMQKWVQWMGSLREQGKFVGAQPLTKDGKQVKGSKKIITDGPYVEGKEIIGGYLICNADTFDEAVTISKDCPLLEFENGIVEVREIQQMPGM